MHFTLACKMGSPVHTAVMVRKSARSAFSSARRNDACAFAAAQPDIGDATTTSRCRLWVREQSKPLAPLELQDVSDMFDPSSLSHDHVVCGMLRDRRPTLASHLHIAQMRELLWRSSFHFENLSTKRQHARSHSRKFSIDTTCCCFSFSNSSTDFRIAAALRNSSQASKNTSNNLDSCPARISHGRVSLGGNVASPTQRSNIKKHKIQIISLDLFGLLQIHIPQHGALERAMSYRELR